MRAKHPLHLAAENVRMALSLYTPNPPPLPPLSAFTWEACARQVCLRSLCEPMVLCCAGERDEVIKR